MSTTVIWCDWGDRDTAMLEQMWQGIPDVHVFHITQWDEYIEQQVDEAIASETGTLLLCGHGSPYGLMAPRSLTEYAVHRMNASTIQAQSIIGIFCHAADFAHNVGLHGLYSGMFISNIEEAMMYCVQTTDDEIFDGAIEVFELLHQVVEGTLSAEDFLSTIQSSNTDNMALRFNIQEFEII